MNGVGAVRLHGVRVADVRHFWPNDRPYLDHEDVLAVVVHHDGVLMAPGDRDYSGSTLDEDLERIDAVHRHSVRQGWGNFPYHTMASPNGRAFLCRDLQRQGSHIYHRNWGTLSVSLMGDLTARRPPDAQLCAAAACIVLMLRRLGRLVVIPGHKDYALPGFGTACPGDTWPGWRDRLLQFVKIQAQASGAQA